MAKQVGMVDDMSQAVIDWLERHHIRGKDVFGWAANRESGTVTTMTISFHVTGVDEMPASDARPSEEAETMDISSSTDVPGQGDRGWSGNWTTDAATEQMSAIPGADAVNPADYMSSPVWSIGRPAPDEPQRWPYGLLRPIKDNPQA